MPHMCSEYVSLTQRELDYLLKNAVNSSCTWPLLKCHHLILGCSHSLIDVEQGAGHDLQDTIGIVCKPHTDTTRQHHTREIISSTLLYCLSKANISSYRSHIRLIGCWCNPCSGFLQLPLLHQFTGASCIWNAFEVLRREVSIAEFKYVSSLLLCKHIPYS